MGKFIKAKMGDKEGIEIDFNDLTGFYEVIFFDENGESTLVKTRNEKVAEKKMKKFERHLKEGRLLKPEKSAYKY